MKAIMFPGQGSQIKGMGAELFDKFAHFTALADQLLGYSIKQLCLYDSDHLLNKTEFTQPALYVVNALGYYEYLQKNEGQLPDYVIGHSLGEYNALLAAEVFDFVTGLRLVKRRGELMSQAGGGAMAAILNLNQEAILDILQENYLEKIDIANFNSPQQTVISGPETEVVRAKIYFEKANALYIPLKVSAAFHSRYMETAALSFESILNEINFSAGKIPVISNLLAREYLGNETKANLKKQISNPVRWVESIQYLLGLGIEQFEEIGPGKVLTKLVETIKTSNILTSSAKKCDNTQSKTNFTATHLGSADFRQAYNTRYAYVSGSMAKGIASRKLVVRMGKAGLMSYYGTGGLKLSTIEQDIQYIQQRLSEGESYGVNLLCNLNNPDAEMATVNLFLRYGITNLEAAAYIQPSLALIKYRLLGLRQAPDGGIIIKHKIMAKISRPEVAEIFLNPPCPQLVIQLWEAGEITEQQASLASQVTLADDLCVESDSGGHTDMGIMTVLLPTILRLRDEVSRRNNYANQVRVGAAGGIGTPEAAAAAFILGADFVLTGSINQCTVEADTSDDVKDLLAELNVQDTDYAPAGDMFEIGAKVQVMKKGVFFPARANKLHELWRNYDSWEKIDEKTRQQIENRYFGRSFEEVYQETKNYFLQTLPQEITKAEQNEKHKMALVFRWYFVHTMRSALEGRSEERVNYQVHTGPALGAFNQWVKGTPLENWRNRHVDEIAFKLMMETAQLLNERFNAGMITIT